MWDDFSAPTKLLLAHRVGHLCSNPNCGRSTRGPCLATERAICIGVAAHITAVSEGGPRFNSSLTPQERRSASNGIWLCHNCAKAVDDDVAHVSTLTLQQWKATAEASAFHALFESPNAMSPVGPELVFPGVGDLSHFFPDGAPSLPEELQPVDYYGWHEGDEDWREGNGLFHAVTYREITWLWSQLDVAPIYEATLLQFVKRGGTVRRVFAFGAEPAAEDAFQMFARVLLRHHILGLAPRVRAASGLHKVRRHLGVRCDTFGSLNGHIGYYYLNRRTQWPAILRTTRQEDLQRLDSAFRRFQEGSLDAIEWLRSLPNQISDLTRRSAEREAEMVHVLCREMMAENGD